MSRIPAALLLLAPALIAATGIGCRLVPGVFGVDRFIGLSLRV